MHRKRRCQRSSSMRTIISSFVLLLLLYWLQGCFSPQTKTILPAEKAEWVYVTPNGRWILFQEARHMLKLLDPVTNQEILISNSGIAVWLDDGLLEGERTGTLGQEYFIVNLEPVTVVNLTRPPGDSSDLPRHIQEADSVYAFLTGEESYTLLLLRRGPSGKVTEGYYVSGARDLDTLLAGVLYKVRPPSGPDCPWREAAPSPDGRYYFINGEDMRIYSQQGELLNSISNDALVCYGWAWDSSGVYVQEQRGGMFVPRQVGPLQLLLAEP